MTPASYVAELLEGIVPESLPMSDRIDPHPRRPGADLAITAAVTMSRGRPDEGVAIARDILERLSLRDTWVSRKEILPPGFINLSFTPLFFISALRLVVDDGARLSHGTPLPANSSLPSSLRLSHMRIAGILRHAVSLGLIWSRTTDLLPCIASGHDIELARQICEAVRFQDVGTPSGRTRRHAVAALSSGIDDFYYHCRVVASPAPLRDARLLLASVAAGLIESM